MTVLVLVLTFTHPYPRPNQVSTSLAGKKPPSCPLHPLLSSARLNTTRSRFNCIHAVCTYVRTYVRIYLETHRRFHVYICTVLISTSVSAFCSALLCCTANLILRASCFASLMVLLRRHRKLGLLFFTLSPLLLSRDTLNFMFDAERYSVFLSIMSISRQLCRGKHYLSIWSVRWSVRSSCGSPTNPYTGSLYCT